jgi:transcriptional regulator with XRE-family HTH domain
LTKKLLTSKAFRKLYVWEQLKRSIPFQVRTMRDERGWSQQRAGKELKKTQSLISRFESPAYGKLSLQTLVEIAEGFDVGLLIKFVPFSRLVKEYEDVSAKALSAKSVTDKEEIAKLEAWAATGSSIDLLATIRRASAEQLRALDQPVSTSAVQHTLVFSSPELIIRADNSTSTQPVIQPQARAAAA